jgi:hypothetical protein
LLGESGTAARAAAFHVLLGRLLDGVPIEPMMLVEAPVLGGDDGVLKVGRDLAEGDETVLLLIRRAVNPGLNVPLDLQRRGRRVHPTGSDQKQRGKRPKRRHCDDEPPDKRPEECLAGSGRRRFYSRCTHIFRIYVYLQPILR